MLSQVPLGPERISVSRIGFGCSRLHYTRRPADRQRILAAALDAGITHFDVAPTYGAGLAERELGVFLASNRGNVTIATKWCFGGPMLATLVPRSAGWHAAILGNAITRVRPPIHPLATPETLRRSVEASLRRLKTTTIDILWLHEPHEHQLVDPAGLVGALGDLVAEGTIRAFGVAGYGRSLGPVLARLNEPDILVQSDENDWPDARVPDITFGVIGRSPQFRGQPAIAPDSAISRLRTALGRRTDGAVLVSTRKEDRLAELSRAAL